MRCFLFPLSLYLAWPFFPSIITMLAMQQNRYTLTRCNHNKMINCTWTFDKNFISLVRTSLQKCGTIFEFGFLILNFTNKNLLNFRLSLHVCILYTVYGIKIINYKVTNMICTGRHYVIIYACMWIVAVAQFWFTKIWLL